MALTPLQIKLAAQGTDKVQKEMNDVGNSGQTAMRKLAGSASLAHRQMLVYTAGVAKAADQQEKLLKLPMNAHLLKLKQAAEAQKKAADAAEQHAASQKRLETAARRASQEAQKQAAAQQRQQNNAQKLAAQMVLQQARLNAMEDRAADRADARQRRAQANAEKAARASKRLADQQVRDAEKVAKAAQKAADDQVKAAERVARAQARAQAQATAQAKANARTVNAAQAWADNLAKASNKQQMAATPNGRIGAYNDFKQKNYGNAEELLGTARNVGLGAMGVAGAGGYAAFKMTETAGQVNRILAGFEGMIGKERGDALFAKLQEFDKASPMTFFETMEQAQQALAQDVKDTEIIPLFTLLGDAVARAGGGTDQFASALTQILQIKSAGKASLQDVKALSQSGKLPMASLIRESLGEEKLKGVMTGQDPLTADEFFNKVLPALEKRTKGGMADAMKQLPGQLDNLHSSAIKLSVALGQQLIPLVSGVTVFLTRAADAFAAMPDWLQKIVVWGGALGIALLGLGGVLLTVAAQAGLAIIGLRSLQGTGGLAGLAGAAQGATGTVGTLGTRIGSVMGSAGPIALFGAAIIGLAVLFKAKADELQKTIDGVESSKFKTNAELGDGNSREGLLNRAAAADERGAAIDGEIEKLKAQKKRAWPIDIYTGMTPRAYQEQIDNLEAEKAGLIRNASKLRNKASRVGMASIPSQLATPGAAAPSMSAMASIGITPAGSGDIGSTAGVVAAYTRQIDALTDLKRHEKDKEKKRQIGDQLIQLQRASRDAKARLRVESQTARNNAITQRGDTSGIDGSMLESLQDRLRHEADPLKRITLGHQIAAARASKRQGAEALRNANKHKKEAIAGQMFSLREADREQDAADREQMEAMLENIRERRYNRELTAAQAASLSSQVRTQFRLRGNARNTQVRRAAFGARTGAMPGGLGASLPIGPVAPPSGSGSLLGFAMGGGIFGSGAGGRRGGLGGGAGGGSALRFGSGGGGSDGTGGLPSTMDARLIGQHDNGNGTITVHFVGTIQTSGGLNHAVGSLAR